MYKRQGQTPPGETAELFGAGMISTGLPELNTVFFPGGRLSLIHISEPTRPY